MKKGKFQKHPVRKMNVKALSLLLVLVLLIGGVIGGTLAWLIDTTDPVTNTFTTSDINITLKETKPAEADGKREAKMIPGWTIDKNPTVTVEAGSEDCYLFVKIVKGNDFDTYLTYAVDTTIWTALDGETDVYYRVVKQTDETKTFSILGNGTYTDINNATYTWAKDQVLTLPTVTKAQMEAIDGKNPDGTDSAAEKQPTLTFTAYATQLYKDNDTQFTEAEAWANVSNPTGTNP